MTKRSILVLTPDYNTPPRGKDGARIDIVHSPYIIEDFNEGRIKIGDPVFLYFDPSGDNGHEYWEGYGIGGTITDLYVKNLRGEDILFVEYKDDFDKEDEQS